MAHECPDCGMQCNCGCDIDDCCNNFPDDVAECAHCDRAECDSDGDDDWDGESLDSGKGPSHG